MHTTLFVAATLVASAVQAQEVPHHGSRAATRAMAAAAPSGVTARRHEPRGLQAWRARADTSRMERWARDTTTLGPARRPLRRRPFIVVGALVGGALGAYAYARTVAGNGDGDFIAPISIPIVVGGGALLGALGGAVTGRLAQAIHGR